MGQIKTWTEQAYQDKLEGTITVDHWKLVSAKWEAENIQLQSQLAALTGDKPDILFTAERILELSQKLPELWLNRNNDETRELVDLLYWNCSLDGATLSATYRKPSSIIAEGTETKIWRALRDEFLKSMSSAEVVEGYEGYSSQCRFLTGNSVA